MQHPVTWRHLDDTRAPSRRAGSDRQVLIVQEDLEMQPPTSGVFWRRSLESKHHVLLMLDFLKNRPPPNYPPGPPALPLLGNVFNIDPQQPHIYLTQLAAVYGNVFSMRLGRDKTVFVSGYKAVREALVTQAHVFVERPYSPMATRLYSDSKGGFFFSNGPVWRTQRRFAMATLRRLGLGSCLENIIWEEIRHLQLEMEDRIGYFMVHYMTI
ncbi:hypothetical protein CRUP_014754 [Coryphaenoides rupestris]|nr:hypothetical protein CRUP_014754 [Coryphaenoides rupestris]